MTTYQVENIVSVRDMHMTYWMGFDIDIVSVLQDYEDELIESIEVDEEDEMNAVESRGY